MADIKDIQNFIKNRYEVVVNIFEDGCLLETPRRHDSLIPQCATYYTIERYSTEGSEELMYAVQTKKMNTNNQVIKTALYNLPIYILRVYIICDIVRACVIRGYPFGATRFVHEGQDVDQSAVFDILKPQFEINDENIEKESLIREIFLDGDYNNEERLSLVDDGVEEGFRLLCNFFLEI